MRELIAENDYAKIEQEDGIIFLQWKKEPENIHIIKVLVEWRLKTINETYPYVFNASVIKKISKEVRDYLAGARAAEKVSTAAIIVGYSNVTLALGNFFLKVNKPKVPTKLFKDEKNSVQWIKTYNAINSLK